jgi:4-amino-4-deoxy-L-arabinose transferase-like glycosyltransferase
MSADLQNNTKYHTVRRTYLALLGLICLGIVANCFFKLSSGPLKDWDEARHGISAYEMVQSGHFLVNTHNHAPDYWNTKPPLSFWSAALGLSLFGANPLGLRFFSALSACLMLFLTLLFCYKRLPLRVAVFSGLVLLSLNMFFQSHNARTADPDALFLLFNTTGLLAVLAWPRRYAAYLVASFLAGLAFLTKSFHVLPLALLLSGFFLKEFSFSRQSLKRAAVCLLVAFAPVALWGIARFQFDGTLFFERMFFYDVLKRSTEMIDNHPTHPLFYLKVVSQNYEYWVVTVPWAVGAVFALRTKALRMAPLVKAPLEPDAKTLTKLVLSATLPLLLYSFSTSKLPWYSYSAFPFISILLGILLDRGCALMETKNKRLAQVFLFCVLATGLAGGARTLMRIHKNTAKQNPVHVAMRELGQVPANHKAALFLDKGDWRPADLLAAKLYGGFQLMEGGVSAYESAKEVGKSFLLSRPEKAHNMHK